MFQKSHHMLYIKQTIKLTSSSLKHTPGCGPDPPSRGLTVCYLTIYNIKLKSHNSICLNFHASFAPNGWQPFSSVTQSDCCKFVSTTGVKMYSQNCIEM